MLLAAFFMFIGCLTLTFAPVVRLHSLTAELPWQQWIGFAVWLIGFIVLIKQADHLVPERDPFLIPLFGIMVGWGLLTLFRLDPNYGLKQTLWLAVSLIGLIVGLRIRNLLLILRRYKYIWLSISLLLAGLTFLIGTYPGGEGPNLWLSLAGVYFQPSEILKVFLIIYLAAYLADSVPAHFRLVQLLTPTFFVAGIALVILVAQRDLGTASLFIALYTVIIYLASGKRRFLLASFLIIVAALIAGYYIFDVIQIRVEGWLNPWSDSNGRSYQIVQSIIAIANGGLFGRGIGLGSPGVVPVAQSDFIFPAIIEETGILGGSALVLLYGFLTLRGITISLKATNQFHRFLAAGVTTYIVSQALLIMGGTIRLLPLTGVTLPYFSYGGSSLVTAFFGALLLLIVSNHPDDQAMPLPRSKPYFLIGTVLFAALGLVILTVTWWGAARANALLARNDNPRRFISDVYVMRGSIQDRNNTVLAETIGQSGTYARRINYPSLSAIIGYSHHNYGQGGLEASLDPVLRGVEENRPFTVFWNRLLYAQYPPGSDVRLSLDLGLQQFSDSLLSGKTGAIVVMNSKSGEILAMSTSPTFDANQIESEWETWKNDPHSPLINRATQAQYPLGAASGGLILARFLSSESLPAVPVFKWSSDPANPNYCAFDPGLEPDWGAIISSGCSKGVSLLSNYLDLEKTNIFFQQIGFLDPFELDFEENASADSIELGSLPQHTQGIQETLVSPMQIAVAYAALSNGGELPNPRMTSAYRLLNGDWQLFDLETTSVQLPLVAGEKALIELNNLTLAGWEISATAITQTGTVDWYIAGTPVDWKGTPLILVVALEDSNAFTTQTLGRRLHNHVVNTSE